MSCQLALYSYNTYQHIHNSNPANHNNALSTDAEHSSCTTAQIRECSAAASSGILTNIQPCAAQPSQPPTATMGPPMGPTTTSTQTAATPRSVLPLPALHARPLLHTPLLRKMPCSHTSWQPHQGAYQCCQRCTLDLSTAPLCCAACLAANLHSSHTKGPHHCTPTTAPHPCADVQPHFKADTSRGVLRLPTLHAPLCCAACLAANLHSSHTK